jgi:micrococcal nuclease
MRRTLIAGAILLGLAPRAGAQDVPFLRVIPGPVPAQVLRVIDGDSLEVRAYVWPRSVETYQIRVLGVDTPEKRGKCEQEKALARVAESFTRGLVQPRDRVELRLVQPDKYGERMLAEVWLADGRSLDALLIQERVSRPYDGGTKQGWC